MAVTAINLMQQNISANNVDKTAPTNASEVPFNQVLSNEIAQHQNLKKTGKPSEQKHESDATAPVGTQDDKLQSAEPLQISVEMLALLGQLPASTSAANTIPTSRIIADDAVRSATDFPGKPGLGKKPAIAITDDLQTDSKAASLPDIRRDAKFTDILKNAEGLSTDPRIAGTEKMDSSAQSIPLPAPLLTISPMQPAAMDMAAGLTNMVTDKLTPRVGALGWDQALSQKVVWMVSGAEQSASLSLNPPDLGPLQVVLTVTNDQANATFISAQPEVRLAIEAAMPKLREMMSDAGIQLGQANVSADNAGQQGAHPDDRKSQNARSITEITTDHLTMPKKIITGQGLVNTFV